VLAGKGVIERALADRMAAWAGLRNLLVHVYLDIDHGRLHDVMRLDLDDLERFAQAMQAEAARG
jgi:uncharacterized protein YutE (UPF0331/DUF86 family)